MGSIDKFGRRKGSRCVGHRGPQGIGFNLTNEKQYDIQGKQLKNIGDPIDEKDCATLKYVNLVVSQSTNLITDTFIGYIKKERDQTIDEVTKLIKNSETKMIEIINEVKAELIALKNENRKQFEAHINLLQDVSDLAVDVGKIGQVIAKHY